MARPHKQGLSYFPHDTDACNDDKVQSLMALYGTDGYAFYFILLEKVFRTENGRITCGSGAIRAGIAKSIGITPERFEIILVTALEIGCFDEDLYKTEGVLTSNGIGKRILSVNNLRLKERERKDKDKGKYKRKRKAIHGKPTENPPSPVSTGVSEAQNLAKFNAFYALYPRKEAKQDALKAWTTLSPNEALLSIILEALKKHKEVWIAEGRETKHIPLPATWIRGRRWEDEIAPKNDWRNNPKGTPLPDRTRHNLAVMDALAREREEKAIEQKRLQEGEKENERLGQG